MNKTSAMICEEFKQEMANLINSSNLPPCVIELVLKDYYNEIHSLAQRQYQIDKAQYEKSLELNEDSKNNE